MEQILADLCRQLPSAHVFCALRLACEPFCALIEHDDELWRERRRALLSFVSPNDYPPALVRDGWILVEWPLPPPPPPPPTQEKEDAASRSASTNASNSRAASTAAGTRGGEEEANDAGDAGGGGGEGEGDDEKEKKDAARAAEPPKPPQVTVLVQGKDREICEAFIKHATQKWAIEHVLRSWRQQFLALSAPMEQFWNRKWNEREDFDIYGKQSNDPLVNNRQIDLEEMQRLCAAARHSFTMRVQADLADRLIEQKEQERIVEQEKQKNEMKSQ